MICRVVGPRGLGDLPYEAMLSAGRPELQDSPDGHVAQMGYVARATTEELARASSLPEVEAQTRAAMLERGERLATDLLIARLPRPKLTALERAEAVDAARVRVGA